MQLSVSEHDSAVRHYAMRMLADGYEVRARVEGWFQEPETIGGYRPDIVARKDGRFIIIEIKKSEIDWPKIKALETFASMRPEFQLQLITPETVSRELRR